MKKLKAWAIGLGIASGMGALAGAASVWVAGSIVWPVVGVAAAGGAIVAAVKYSSANPPPLDELEREVQD